MNSNSFLWQPKSFTRADIYIRHAKCLICIEQFHPTQYFASRIDFLKIPSLLVFGSGLRLRNSELDLQVYVTNNVVWSFSRQIVPMIWSYPSYRTRCWINLKCLIIQLGLSYRFFNTRQSVRALFIHAYHTLLSFFILFSFWKEVCWRENKRQKL